MSAIKFDPWAAIGMVAPQDDHATFVLDDELEREERLAIQNAPCLPEPGAPARKVIDLAQERMVRGLLLGAWRG